MKKWSFLVLVAWVGTGCAVMQTTKSNVNEASTVLRTMGPKVSEYISKNHKCPSFHSEEYTQDAWAKQLQTTQSAHWTYDVIPGQEPEVCFIGAAYKHDGKKVGEPFPHLTLKVNKTGPDSVIVLDVQELMNVTHKKQKVIVVKTYDASKNTCQKWGGQTNEEFGCVVF